MQILGYQNLLTIPDFGKRSLAFVMAVIGLSLVYFYQQFNYLGYIAETYGREFHSHTEFVINKTVRYLLNDNLCLLLIYAFFNKRTYIMVGVLVEMVGLVFLLPLYFVLKLSFEGDTELSSPLLSFLHRLIINPTLMILLIIGMFYQQKTSK